MRTLWRRMYWYLLSQGKIASLPTRKWVEKPGSEGRWVGGTRIPGCSEWGRMARASDAVRSATPATLPAAGLRVVGTVSGRISARGPVLQNLPMRGL